MALSVFTIKHNEVADSTVSLTTKSGFPNSKCSTFWLVAASLVVDDTKCSVAIRCLYSKQWRFYEILHSDTFLPMYKENCMERCMYTTRSSISESCKGRGGSVRKHARLQNLVGSLATFTQEPLAFDTLHEFATALESLSGGHCY